MPIKNLQPDNADAALSDRGLARETSPSRRPEKSLVEGKKRTGGRNSTGA